MNIQDKAKLFGEMRRVLKDGARIGVYDVMRVQPDEIPFPVPWAASPATSFLETPDTYRRLLTEAGFELQSERNQRELTLKLSREMREHVERHGPAAAWTAFDNGFRGAGTPGQCDGDA